MIGENLPQATCKISEVRHGMLGHLGSSVKPIPMALLGQMGGMEDSVIRKCLAQHIKKLRDLIWALGCTRLEEED